MVYILNKLSLIRTKFTSITNNGPTLCLDLIAQYYIPNICNIVLTKHHEWYEKEDKSIYVLCFDALSKQSHKKLNIMSTNDVNCPLNIWMNFLFW